MNYNRILNNTNGLRQQVKPIVKDINKRILDIEDLMIGDVVSLSKQLEECRDANTQLQTDNSTLTQEKEGLESQIEELQQQIIQGSTPPEQITFDNYIDITEIKFNTFSGSVYSPSSNYDTNEDTILVGGLIRIIIPTTHLIIPQDTLDLSFNDYIDTIKSSLKFDNLSINDVHIPIAAGSGLNFSERKLYYMLNANLPRELEVQCKPIDNIISIDISKADGSASTTLMGKMSAPSGGGSTITNI